MGGPLGRLGTAALVMRDFCSSIDAGPDRPGGGFGQRDALVGAARRDVITAARFNLTPLMGDGWVGAGSILADLDQLFADLSAAARELDAGLVREF
jgi:hypothetical protein